MKRGLTCPGRGALDGEVVAINLVLPRTSPVARTCEELKQAAADEESVEVRGGS